MADVVALESPEQKAKTYREGECPDPQCPLVSGVCQRCGLRDGPYPETIALLGLWQEIQAGIPLERDQLGITELGVVAELRERQEARRMVGLMAGRALGG